MRFTLQNMLIVVMGIVIIILSFLVGRQSVAPVSKLELNGQAGSLVQQQRVLGSQDSQEIGFPSPLSTKEIIAQSTDVAGDIKLVERDYIIIEGELIREVEGSIPPETYIKEYKVSFTDTTKFTTRKAGELKIGDYVRAFSDEPVYEKNEFTAIYVTYLPARGATSETLHLDYIP